MNLNSIWSALEESFELLGAYGFPAMGKVATELSLEPGWMTWIAGIWLFGSEPITTTKFMYMLPYGLASTNEERFASAVKQGYLFSDGKNGFFSTEDGMKVAQRVWREAGNSLAHLQPIPEENLQRLFIYLDRLIEASLSAPEPPPHFFITHKKENYQRFCTMYPLEHFVVLFGELSAYRDDSHIAAWHVHNIEGNLWEVLTYIWRGEAATLDGLHNELNYRGISRDGYAKILQELMSRGWIKEGSGDYQLTAEGQKIRQEAEELTDRYFFTPWTCLSDTEQEDLLSLATQLRDGLLSSKE